MAHSKYKFKWDGTIKKNDIVCPMFSLTSSTGMVWRGYFSEKDDAVRFVDGNEKNLSVEFVFIGPKFDTIPRRGQKHLLYKLNRFVLNSVIEDLERLFKIRNGVYFEKL